MKVHIRLDGQVKVVDDVGVDDRCLPMVSGARPYDSASKDISPLVLQSALWFKTLAVEAVYIDCSQRLICWIPVCTADIQDGQVPVSPTAVLQDFIPLGARPLFEDNSVYDFDASLKEMMYKCSITMHKFSRKFVSVDEFNKIIARLLHVYILPSIHFRKDDVASLLQVKCQVEERLAKVEESIKAKAVVKENVKICLDKMMDKLLCEENLDSERYLRSCDRDFLTAVLKVVERNVAALNTDLSAIQNMINWVKEHPGDGHKLTNLKATRDQIFAEVDQRIQVRETIRNVAFRRHLSKRKIKCKVIKSCVHNMFTEVVRQLELQEAGMRELGDDKVSTCAAREAVLYTLSNLADSSKYTASFWQFELETLTSFSVNDNKIDQSNCWLPLAGRVSKTLENKKTVAYMCHEYGCQKLSAQSVHILKDFLPATVKESIHSSEAQPQSIQSVQTKPQSVQTKTQSFQTHVLNVQPCDQHEETSYDDLSCQFSLSLSEVTLRHPKLITKASSKREAIYLSEDRQLWKTNFHQPDIWGADTVALSCDSGLSLESLNSPGTQTQSIHSPGTQTHSIQPCDQHEETSFDNLSCQFSLSLSDVTMRQPKLVHQTGHKGEAIFLPETSGQLKRDFQPADFCDAELSKTAVMSGISRAQSPSLQGRDDLPKDYILVPGYRSSTSVVFTETESLMELQQPPPPQMTMSMFMDAVEELKGQIQAHLTEVIDLLGQETLESESDDMTLKEQQELLWRSYDRFFCKELYTQLHNLYTVGLTPGIQQAYAELCNLSVLDILRGDRLLTLFFGSSILRGSASPIPIPRPARDRSTLSFSASAIPIPRPARDRSTVSFSASAIPIPRPVRDRSTVSFSAGSRDLDDFTLSFGVGSCNSVGTETSLLCDQASRWESVDSMTQSIDEGFYQPSSSFSGSLCSTVSGDNLNPDADDTWEYSFNPRKIEDKLTLVLSPFMKFVGVCLGAECFNEKIRYITKAIEGLNDSISCLFGLDFQSTCDDIISMLVLALCNIPEEMFLSLYVDLRLLMDVLPGFFFGSRWDFNLVSLYSAYNYLFTLKISDHIVHKF